MSSSACSSSQYYGHTPTEPEKTHTIEETLEHALVSFHDAEKYGTEDDSEKKDAILDSISAGLTEWDL